jgi:hypothetical protein
MQFVAHINVAVDDELDKQFRSEVHRRFGMKKGNIKISLEQAMRLWIESKL